MQYCHQWQHNTDQHHYEENSGSFFMLNQRSAQRKAAAVCNKPTLSLYYKFSNFFFMFSLILVFNSHLPLTGQNQRNSSTAPLYQNGSLAHVKQAPSPA